MHVVAIPNAAFPPPDDVLALADVVLDRSRSSSPTLSARAAADEIHPVTDGEQHVLDALVFEHAVVESADRLVLSS